MNEPTNNNRPPHSYLNYLLLLILSLVILSIILLSAIPPVSRDALSHHLAVPKLWIMDGGIYEYPHIPFSYYPMNLDILYAVSLYFGNDIAPKFIHFFFGILTSGLIFFYLKKRMSVLYGLIGALFFLSLPVVVKLSITVYVDLGLVFFSTASIIYFLKWIEYDFPIKHIIISAIWCGLALGTKYNGLLLFFLLACLVPYFYSRKTVSRSSDQSKLKKQFKAIGNCLLFISVSLAIFSPWLIKNTIQTGNPIYPLGKQIFHSYKKDFAPSSTINFINNYNEDVELNHFLIRKLIFKEKWWETTLIPIRIFFQGKDNLPQYFDGKLNPFLFLLPFFTFFLNRKNRNPTINTEQSILALFSVLYLLLAFLITDMRIRYILPIIPPLIILSIYGMQEIFFFISKYPIPNNKAAKVVLTLLTITMISMNATYILNLFRYVDPFPYITGSITRDNYIETKRPEYAVYQYINQNLPANSFILGIFIGKRGYYCDRKIIFDFKLFEKSVIYSKLEKEIGLNLKDKGLTHLIINHNILNKWSKVHFDDAKYKSLTDFLKNAKLVFSKRSYALYQL